MDKKIQEMLDSFQVPSRKLLDHLTRSDELLVQLIEQFNQLIASQGGPIPPSWSYEQLESGEITDYAIITQSLTTATTNKPMGYEGDTIVAQSDGTLTGITIRLNRQDADAIPLAYFNPLKLGRFRRFYLTWTAQAGKTLTLFIGRNLWAKVDSPPEHTGSRLIRWGKDIEPVWTHAVEQTAPAGGTALVTQAVTAGKSGYIYGLFISTQEINDFLLNWTSGGVAKSKRLVFGGTGTTEAVDPTPMNEGLPADAGTNITITNVNAATAGMIYQAQLLYAEL